jgi:hypothetical protein
VLEGIKKQDRERVSAVCTLKADPRLRVTNDNCAFHVGPKTIRLSTMMNSIAAVACLLAATATAFAPSQQQLLLQQQQQQQTVSLSAFAKGYVGGDGPEPMFIGKTGSKDFDPLGFTEVRGTERYNAARVFDEECVTFCFRVCLEMMMLLLLLRREAMFVLCVGKRMLDPDGSSLHRSIVRLTQL